MSDIERCLIAVEEQAFLTFNVTNGFQVSAGINFRIDLQTEPVKV